MGKFYTNVFAGWLHLFVKKYMIMNEEDIEIKLMHTHTQFELELENWPSPSEAFHEQHAQ